MEMFNLNVQIPQMSQFSVEGELAEVSGEHGEGLFFPVPHTLG